eukprot:COSAG02_NODE_6417_length_3586_cov_1.850014_3_plen_50_part_00
MKDTGLRNINQSTAWVNRYHLGDTNSWCKMTNVRQVLLAQILSTLSWLA